MKQFNKKLLQGKQVAVNCTTPEQAQDFVNWVVSLGEDSVINTGYVVYKEFTCYELQESLSWNYGDKAYYKRYGYEIVSYEEALLKEIKQEVQEEVKEETTNGRYIISYEVIADGEVLGKSMIDINLEEFNTANVVKMLLELHNNDKYKDEPADNIFIVNIFKF